MPNEASSSREPAKPWIDVFVEVASAVGITHTRPCFRFTPSGSSTREARSLRTSGKQRSSGMPISRRRDRRSRHDRGTRTAAPCRSPGPPWRRDVGTRSGARQAMDRCRNSSIRPRSGSPTQDHAFHTAQSTSRSAFAAHVRKAALVGNPNQLVRRRTMHDRRTPKYFFNYIYIIIFHNFLLIIILPSFIKFFNYFRTALPQLWPPALAITSTHFRKCDFTTRYITNQFF